MKEDSNSSRIPWIDMAKGVAIIAVILNHIYKDLNDSDYLYSLSLYSVGLFVIISGVTSFSSYKRNKGNSKDAKGY